MSPFDCLVDDLRALDAARNRERAQLTKAFTKPPADFSGVRREQSRLQKAIAVDHERHTRARCAATIARLDQAARSGRLTGVQAGTLDALRAKFGTLLKADDPTPTPTQVVDAAINRMNGLLAAYARHRDPVEAGRFQRLWHQTEARARSLALSATLAQMLDSIQSRAVHLGLLSLSPRAA